MPIPLYKLPENVRYIVAKQRRERAAKRTSRRNMFKTMSEEEILEHCRKVLISRGPLSKVPPEPGTMKSLRRMALEGAAGFIEGFLDFFSE